MQIHLLSVLGLDDQLALHAQLFVAGDLTVDFIRPWSQVELEGASPPRWERVYLLFEAGAFHFKAVIYCPFVLDDKAYLAGLDRQPRRDDLATPSARPRPLGQQAQRAAAP
jgi:hypothetical protein